MRGRQSESSKISLSKAKLNFVVAHTDKNRYIAYKNAIPWEGSIKSDWVYITKLIRLEPNVALIMGRKTFEAVPLMKDIVNIVVTSHFIDSEYVHCCRNVDEAVKYCKEMGKTIVIFGGTRIYEDAMKYDYKLFCTIIQEGSMKGDRVFPHSEVSLENISEQVDKFLLANDVKKTWSLEKDSSEEHHFEEGGYIFKFFVGETDK